MQLEQSVDIEAAPDSVWAIIKDVERWHEWTESIKSVELLDGAPLAPDSRARVRQPKLPPAVWKVTDLQDGREFSWQARGIGFTSTGVHRVEPRPEGGSRATLGIHMDGPLAGVFGLFMKGITKRYVAMEAAGLKQRTEAGSHNEA
ncbi:MAG: polyketide cyclase [Dehalococcoidia bacterium]|nr:polyketide cyclase [Dehalococcoidia bacterium]